MDCETVREEMLGVLYGEADAATLCRVEEHHARCATCREELAALRKMRRRLAEWTVPGGPRRLALRRAWGVLPWLAAAAGLLLALGGAVGLSGGELRFETGPLAIRVGGEGDDVRVLLAAEEARHRREIEVLRASLGPTTPRDEEALLPRVAELIRESELRQAAVLQASLRDFSQRSEAQRRYDLAQVSAGLAYLEGKTGQQVARTTELMGYVLQASQER